MKKLAVATLALCAACSGGGGSLSPAPTVPPPPPPPDRIGPIEDAIQASAFTDVLVLIGDDQGRLLARSKGMFDEDQVESIASATKMLTGVIITRMVEDGQLSFDDQPQEYLSYWTDNGGDPRSEVTLRQLLAFTSGLNYPPGTAGCINDPFTTIQACAQEFYERGLGSRPGEGFYYGPGHMQVAAAMAEEATGESWASLTQTYLLDPLGISETEYRTPSRANPRISGGGISSAEEYEAILVGILDGTLINDLDAFVEDQTADVAFLSVPVAAEVDDRNWHYARGFWIECDTAFNAACADNPTISSTGAFGWTPWIDFESGYYGVIATRTSAVPNSRPGVESVRLEQELQPLIEEALSTLRANR